MRLDEEPAVELADVLRPVRIVLLFVIAPTITTGAEVIIPLAAVRRVGVFKFIGPDEFQPVFAREDGTTRSGQGGKSAYYLFWVNIRVGRRCAGAKGGGKARQSQDTVAVSLRTSRSDLQQPETPKFSSATVGPGGLPP
jgi:hypothetical protein